MRQQNAPPKLRRVRRLDSIRLDADDRTYFTEEGYLVDHPVLTSVGIFEYRNPDGTVRRELRLPEHVFAENSLKTYRGKPVIITHSAGKISKDNVDQEQIGTILSDGYQDGDDVRAEIIIHNTDAMKACGLKELSLGYNLDLVDEPGEWNGQPYDAVQTNIVINHLALVASARAGDQAHLNIDGSDGADDPALQGRKMTILACSSGKTATNTLHLSSGKSAGVDDKKGKGGTRSMNGLNMDSFDMTPEQLVEAINLYKASHGGSGDPVTSADAAGSGSTANGDPKGGVKKEPDTLAVAPASAPADPAVIPGKKDGNDTGQLAAVLGQLLTVLEGMKSNIDGAWSGAAGTPSSAGTGSPDGGSPADDSPDSGFSKDPDDRHADSSVSMSQSLNADSADNLFRQRLGICRIGDQLGMTGLEAMTILDGKKAVIAKVLPDMHLDGRDTAYVDAAYDFAVSQAMKRKDVNYQRQQMSSGRPASTVRNDSMNGGSMAARARQNMLDREGGKE